MTAYLILAISGFTVFAVTLAWVSIWSNSNARSEAPVASKAPQPHMGGLATPAHR